MMGPITIQALFFLVSAICFILSLLNVNLGKVDLVTLGLLLFVVGHLPWQTPQPNRPT